MEQETVIAKPHLPRNNRSHNASLPAFDLPALIESMKNSHAWTKGELNAMILLKSPERQIVLTTLHEGTEIESFQSNDSITFQIIEGKLRLHTPKESVTLQKGQLLTLHDNIKYSLTSREETVFLLTIANGILQPAEN
jgi:quercetin dioxygenase-like cupin family protein